jgi:hypothetical protein
VFASVLAAGAGVVGYQIVTNTGMVVAESLITPVFTPVANGDTFKLTPKFFLGNGTAL